MSDIRIASLLPSATEILCALGLEDLLVGVSHSCDYPDAVRRLPILTRTSVPVQAEGKEIDRVVRRTLAGGESLYELDLDALAAVRADLVVSQRLCDLCAVSTDAVDAAMCDLDPQPMLIDLEPSCLHDVFEDILRVARFARVLERGEKVVAALQQRLNTVTARSASLTPEQRPRVAVIEWLDPVFNSGHWVPDLVAAAGGNDVLGPVHQPSHTINWASVREARPDVLLLSVCGYTMDRMRQEWSRLPPDGERDRLLKDLNGRVLLLDGNAYFARPGPRLIDGLEGLAHALHPHLHPKMPQAAPLERLFDGKGQGAQSSSLTNPILSPGPRVF